MARFVQIRGAKRDTDGYNAEGLLSSTVWTRSFPLVGNAQRMLRDEKVIGDVQRIFCDLGTNMNATFWSASTPKRTISQGTDAKSASPEREMVEYVCLRHNVGRSRSGLLVEHPAYAVTTILPQMESTRSTLCAVLIVAQKLLYDGCATALDCLIDTFGRSSVIGLRCREGKRPQTKFRSQFILKRGIECCDRFVRI